MNNIPMAQSLAVKFPDVANEWNEEKNGLLTPKDFLPSSKQRVWWKCRACGYEWERPIADRTSKRPIGCRRCTMKRLADAQRVPIKGVNDLATTHPELLKDWDHDKNTEFTPETIKAGSGYKVWWKCENNHSWQAAPLNRSRGVGCPFCAQEIRSSFPEQAIFFYVKQYFSDAINGDREIVGKELDIYIPSKAVAVEYDGVKWHSNETSRIKDEKKDMLCKTKGIRMFRIREVGLPSLSTSNCIIRNGTSSHLSLSAAIRQLLSQIDDHYQYDVDVNRDLAAIYNMITYKRKENSLKDVFPDVAAEWDVERNGVLSPEAVTPGSGKQVYWICEKGHSWRATISSRTAGNGCPYCSNHHVLPGFNDLKTVDPNLALEWDFEKNEGVKPEEVLAGSANRYWWKCRYGHPSWKTSVDSRRQGDGCPYCSGRGLLPGINDLATVNPKLAREWDSAKNGIPSSGIRPNSNKQYWWVCDKGHSWKASPGHRSQGHGCPYCSGYRVISGETDLATVNPQLAKQWDAEKNNPLTPQDVSNGSSRQVWWRCEKGHSWQASITSRQRGRGCPYCVNKKVLKGYNDLATTNPDIICEWNAQKNAPLTPDDVMAGSERVVWWRCAKGHEWNSSIAHRVRSKGCPFCAGHRIAPGENDLASLNPKLVEEWDYEKNDLQPKRFSEHSGQKAWWICKKGHSWMATIASRVAGNGCPYCSNKQVLSGYNDLATTMPSLVEEWDYVKNGKLTPRDVASKSGKKVWWKCAKGHSWQAIIKSRSEGSGCPYCSNKRALAGENDLRSKYPDVATEWNYSRNSFGPENITCGSSKKVWWRCSRCGYEWESRVSHRTSGHGCPSCARKSMGLVNGRRVMCVETQVVYDNAAIAGKSIGVTAGAISSCARGETKTAGKRHWKYV